MKKVYIIITMLIFSISISTLKAETPTQDNENTRFRIYAKALFLKSEGKYDEAIELLQGLTTTFKSLERVYFQIADCYYQQMNFPEAQKHILKAMRINPTYAEPYILQYNIYNSLKNYDEAAHALTRLLQFYPDNVEYNYTLGVHYFKNLKNYNLAAYYFKKLIKLGKNMPIAGYYVEQSHLFLLNIAVQQKEYDQSITHLDEASKINATNNEKFYHLANVLIEDNEPTLAVICLDKYLRSIQKNPEHDQELGKIYTYMARIYYIIHDRNAVYYLRKTLQISKEEDPLVKALFLESLHRDQEAEPLLTTVTQKSPSYISPYIALARIYKRKHNDEKAYNHFLAAGIRLYKLNRYKESLHYFLQAAAIKPDIARLHFFIAQLYEKQDQIAMAIYHFKKSYELEKDLDILIHIAYLYSIEQKFEQSNEYFFKAIKDDANYAQTYFLKGLAESRKKSFPAAEKAFQKAIDLKKDEHSFYFYLAISQEKQQKYSSAMKALEKALAYDKENPSYANYLGYLYADNNIHLDKAVELINKALKHDPYNGAYLDSLGWAYFKQGKYDLALKFLIEAELNLEAIDAPDPVVFDHLGDIYKELGNITNALLYWNKSLSIEHNPKIKIKIEKNR